MHGSARKLFLGVLLTVLCLALFVPAAWAADGDVTVTVGPTPIENGSCLGANDITVENGLFAVSFAVDSTPPWGVPNGSILDGATYDAAGNLNDRLTLVDFLPNGWAAWPNTYQNIDVLRWTPPTSSSCRSSATTWGSSWSRPSVSRRAAASSPSTPS